MDGEEEKRGLILTERKVEGIHFPGSSRTDICPPTHGFSDRDTEISLSE
jgi:hypothetical protein